MAEPIRVLIVDDETEFLQAIAQRLEMRGLDVTTAGSGEEALEEARGGACDIALVDLKMPGMDGRELLERLKEEHRFLEVVILTGHGSLGSAVECAKLGAFGYLPKPYDMDQLLGVLTEAYHERLKKKFAANEKRLEELMRIAQKESPLGILRRMKELDTEND